MASSFLAVTKEKMTIPKKKPGFGHTSNPKKYRRHSRSSLTHSRWIHDLGFVALIIVVIYAIAYYQPQCALTRLYLISLSSDGRQLNGRNILMFIKHPLHPSLHHPNR